MMAAKPGVQLSTLFESAILFSIRKHEGQYRKGNRAPYVSHPMAVASIVLECGGTEEQAMAALLHDTIEDCGVTKKEIIEKFGDIVGELVDECTEKLDKEEFSWRERKENYLQQLRGASEKAIAIILCDKYHNLLSLKKDLDFREDKAWVIFKESKNEVEWYYRELAKIFQTRKDWQPTDRINALKLDFLRLIELVFGR